MSRIKATRPLHVRYDWAPAYLKQRHDQNRDFAFSIVDAEGAPSADGRRYHSAVDWFAPGGTTVVSPVDGMLAGVTQSTTMVGQVFGGVVRIRDGAGRVWVMRHVDPKPYLPARIAAGESIGKVTPWRDGAPHLHMEIWKTLAGGYQHENMIDPRDVDFAVPAYLYFFEELPEVKSQLGDHFRFGPWETAAMRDRIMDERRRNTGRRQRPFKGKTNSLYPWE